MQHEQAMEDVKPRTRRRLWRLVGLAALAFVVAHAALAAYLWNEDPVFLQRALSYDGSRAITGVEWYTPMAPVRGGPEAPWPRASAALDAAALREVARYAEERDSAALWVVHRGEVLVERYFNGGDADGLTNGMSMTKTLVALLVGVALDRGELRSIDDPVALYLPELADERRDVTLRHLLQMTSGLRRWSNQLNPLSDIVRMHLGRDALGVALAVPAHDPPGQSFSYNNVNTQLLGRVLEVVGRKPLPELLSERLWQPLGARDAQWWLDRPEGAVKAYCCFFARAGDWARVGQLLLQRGRWNDAQIVSAAWIDAMAQPSPHEPHYGLHVWVFTGEPGRRSRHMRAPFAASPVWWLDGKDEQRVYVVLERDLVVVRVGEAADWDESWVVNRVLEALPRN